MMAQDDMISDDEIQKIVDELSPEEWRRYARKLGMSDLDIRMIEFDKRFEGTKETIFQVLLSIRQRTGNEATLKRFREVLKRVRVEQPEVADFSHAALDAASLAISDEEQSLLDGVATMLRSRYRAPNLPTFGWMNDKVWPLEDLFVDLELKEVDKRGGQGKSISLQQIFVKDKCAPRILIEACSGYGKSTLLSKIASDWANDKKCFGECSFLLVILIKLRNYGGYINSSIENEIKLEDTEPCKLLPILAKIEQQVLLLLDGYDEMSQDLQDRLQPLLEGRQFPRMTVAFTARTSCFDLGRTNQHQWLTKRIRICGVRKEQSKAFLQKYFKRDLQDAAVPSEDLTDVALCDKVLHVINQSPDGLFSCPLFLILLVFVVEENRGCKAVETKTKLYKHVLNLSIKRNLIREGLITDKYSIELFKPQTGASLMTQVMDCFYYNSPYLSDLLNIFGRFAMKNLKNSQFCFTKEEIPASEHQKNEIIHLGFLTRKVLHKEHKEIEVLQVVHPSFLDFFSAFYLARLGTQDDQQKRFVNRIRSLLHCGLQPERCALLFSFLGGLMGNKGYRLLDALKPETGSPEPHYLTMVRNIFSEMQLTEELLKSVLPCLPTVVVVGRSFEDDLYLQPRLEGGEVDVLSWNLEHSLNISKGFQVKCLAITMNNSLSVKIARFQNYSMACDEFSCRIREMTKDAQNAIWTLLHRVAANHKTLILPPNALAYMIEEVGENQCIFDDLIIDQLWKADATGVNALQTIVSCGLVKKRIFVNGGILLAWVSDTTIKKLFQTILESSSLEEITIKVTCAIDLSRLCLLYKDVHDSFADGTFPEICHDPDRAYPTLIFGSLVQFNTSYQLLCQEFPIKALYVPSLGFQAESDNLASLTTWLKCQETEELCFNVDLSFDRYLIAVSHFQHLQVLVFHFHVWNAEALGLWQDALNSWLSWLRLKAVVIYQDASCDSFPNVIVRCPWEGKEKGGSVGGYISWLFGWRNPHVDPSAMCLKLVNVSNTRLVGKLLEWCRDLMRKKAAAKCVLASSQWCSKRQIGQHFPQPEFAIDLEVEEPVSAFENFKFFKVFQAKRCFVVRLQSLKSSNESQNGNV